MKISLRQVLTKAGLSNIILIVTMKVIKELIKMKKCIHHWVRVANKPWFSSFGSDVVLQCSICHIFTNVSEEEVSNFESKTRLVH